MIPMMWDTYSKKIQRKGSRWAEFRTVEGCLIGINGFGYVTGYIKQQRAHTQKMVKWYILCVFYHN